ncbi:hypothetical protein NFI96_003081 [Prochilodus magdalenae]|nr:hypothetical protein NFI96_003081 [Prochilodus magdalenae]
MCVLKEASWRPPPAESQNGPLAGYIVRYAMAGGGAESRAEPAEEVQVPPTSSQIALQRLEKWTMYHISVAAATAVGPGPESLALVCRTDEDGLIQYTEKQMDYSLDLSTYRVSYMVSGADKMDGECRYEDVLGLNDW